MLKTDVPKEADTSSNGRLQFSHVLSQRDSEMELSEIINAKVVPSITVEVVEEGKAWLLRNVYSKEECEKIIAECERLTFDSLSKEFRSDYRKNDRLVIYSEELAADFYRRMEPHLPDQVKIENNDYTLGFGLGGNWNKAKCNPMIRLCRYVAGGLFCAHQDGHYLENSECRSFYTSMMYLNGGFKGGETNFLDREKSHVTQGPAVKLASREAITYSVVPEAGMVIVFWHPMLHEGALLEEGVKYVMRSEVMYRRAPGTAEQLSDNDKEAIMLFDAATTAEMDGKYDEAASLYRRAFKKSQKLADAYQS